MTNNFFEPQEVNLQVQPLPTYIDSDGVFKINTPMLATYNFDGLIPKYDGAISASAVKPGYLIQLDTGGQYYPVVSVESDDDVLESTGLVTINYIDDLGNTNSESYGETDQVSVIYENWAEKIVGSQGWGITSGGNAIFTNVAVRGRIEADEGYISGNLTIGAGGSTTLNDVTTADDLTGFITAPELQDNTTIISGGNIKTGTIQSAGFATPTAPYKYDGSEFASNGMAIVLGGTNAGALIAKNFKISPNGDAEFKGSITGAAIQTAEDGPRIILSSPSSTNNIVFLTGSNNEGNFGRINTTPATSNLQLNFVSPMWTGGTAAQINLLSENDGTSQITLNATKIIPTSIIQGSITGNAGTVTNGVYTNGSYANPSWITSLAGSKITGNILGNANNITLFSINQNLGTGSNVNFNTITTATAGSSIKPIAFTNSQQSLQIRLSDSLIGYFTSVLSVKENIVPLIGDIPEFIPNEKIGGSAKNLSFNPDNIFNITPIEFININDENKEKQIGFLVEDLLETWPSAVTYDNDGPVSYNTNSIVAGLVYAIKKQKELIENLENRVLQLESQLGG